jgi:hypothetical protein
VALVVLAGLVLVLSPKERKGLLSGSAESSKSSTWMFSTQTVALLTGAAGFVLAAGFEIWTAAEGTPKLAIPGMLAVLGVHHGLRLVNRHAA